MNDKAIFIKCGNTTIIKNVSLKINEIIEILHSLDIYPSNPTGVAIAILDNYIKLYGSKEIEIINTKDADISQTKEEQEILKNIEIIDF